MIRVDPFRFQDPLRWVSAGVLGVLLRHLVRTNCKAKRLLLGGEGMARRKKMPPRFA